MHKHLTFAFLMLYAFAFSQKQDNLWYFGEHNGLDFSSGTPITISGGQTGAPNCANGIYLLSIRTGENLLVKKLIRL